MEMRRTRWVLVWLWACGGTAVTGRTVSTPSSGVAPPSAAVVDDGPHFSVRETEGSALVHALHFAQGISLREHPRGGVVVLGCSEGPTDLTGDRREREALAFLARVDPSSGAIAWVRHVRLGAGAFANGCRVHVDVDGARSATRPAMAIDEEGRMFVTLWALATDASVLGTSGSVAAGPTALAFDSAGALLWSRPLGAADRADAVAGMALNPEGGVDMVMRRAQGDGLDENAFVHLDIDGQLTERAVLSAAVAPGRAEPCHVGAGGCGASIEWVNRDPDGLLVVYGTARGVVLSLGRDTVTTQADGLVASGFWASLDSRGRIRWLRESEGVFTALVDAYSEGVLVNRHDPQSHQDEALFVRPGYGDPRPAMREALRGDAGVALALVERQQRAVPEASLTSASGSRSLRPTLLEERLAAEDVARLLAFDPNGVATSGVRLADGALVRLENVYGTLVLGATTLGAEPRMEPCHPGPVGEERSLPSGCLEPSEQPMLALIHWPVSTETMDSPERARVLGLLTRERRVHWRIPAAAGGRGDGCARFTVQVSTSARGEARPSGFLRGFGVRPSWAFTVEADGVRIHSPSVVRGVNSFASGQCETRIAFADFPRENAASCESHPRVFDPGACGPALASLVRPPEPPSHLLRRLQRRGRVWFSGTAEDGSRQCDVWTVRPAPVEGVAAAGAIVRRERNGEAVTEVSLDYRLNGRDLTLLGPSTERFVNGELTEGHGMGCGETLTVIEDRPTHAEVGGQGWYFTERACRAAPDGVGGGPGGC